MLAGPNGSGKSTFTREVQSGVRLVGYAIPPVINPDVIAQGFSPDDPDGAAAPAAREALRQRSEALARRESFSIETTLSGRSELRLIDDARSAGYRISMTYLALESPDVNVDRVSIRALEERRTVPAQDVRRRYERSLDALGDVAQRIDVLHVFDNSGKTFAHVATLERGRVIEISQDVPRWAERALGQHFAVARDRSDLARAASNHLRTTKSTILPSTIAERPLRATALITGRVIAVSQQHVAITTTPNTFSIVERATLDRQPSVDERVRISFRDGRGVVSLHERGQGRSR